MRMLEMYKKKKKIKMKFQINQLKFIPNFHKRDGIQLFIIPFEYFNELIESGKITTFKLFIRYYY